MNKMKKTTFALLATPAVFSLASAGVINDANYTNDFTSSASDFTTTAPATATWSLDTGAGTFGYVDEVSGDYLAAVQNTFYGGSAETAESFTLSGTVYYPGPDGPGSSDQLGMFFLGDANDPTNAYHFYLRGVQSNGFSVFLAKEVGDVLTTLDADGDGSHELRDYIGYDISYDITATYSGGELSIAATFTSDRDSDSYTLNYTDSDPLTGDFFGMWGKETISGRDEGAEWNNFSMQNVPEPSTYAMLAGFAGLAVAFIRRRKR
ncbi:PEP-CTERM sorting domain-containing protein [Cerasicoccus frondis]|uniref:PEP-CTERM sorting domain-containing protein n=1 Tax=Cerasicoccus frondis TaxID=490090 RepID=UPI002852B4BD|nr:PEP-CTERM sorting domain-containing protein [Cerasicoccus frondis]